eukprot:UN13848
MFRVRMYVFYYNREFFNRSLQGSPST